MDAPRIFLIGGPAFSGTTLLAVLLNQHGLVCLDEPDFEDPDQSHRGIPLLRSLFPDRIFPDPPGRPLDSEEQLRLVEQCAQAIAPLRLGVKTCDRKFVEHARQYRRAGYPVIAIVRDIRDALVRALPPWETEENLNFSYRLVWGEIETFDLWLRYEDLVAGPEAALAPIGTLLGTPSLACRSWPPERVNAMMLKLDRHELLLSGRISTERVGIWRKAGRRFEAETHETARIMGY
jgi:hypothetical protein